MKKETIRELRERADEMISVGIANKDALFAALPVLTDLQTKAEGASDEELADRGLAAKVKNVWSLAEE